MNDVDDIYENIDECNWNKYHMILIVFEDMITDMVSNKSNQPIVTEFLIKGEN